MKRFEDTNPIAVFVYYLFTAGFSMFSLNPVLLALSLLGAYSFFFLCCGTDGLRTHLYGLLLVVVMTLVNPLFQHSGATVLLVLNDNPVTLEAFLYGAVSGMMVLAVLCWFRSFTHLMTSDKLLYLFASLSARLALLLSMILRFIPLFIRQAKKVSASQKAMGLYQENTWVDRVRGGLRIFSVMVTWALENGIITADSMSARGYGLGKRTHFSPFRFTRSDLVLLLITFALSAPVLLCLARGALTYRFFPYIVPPAYTLPVLAGYASYGMLSLLPALIETGDMLKWRCLKSKI